MLARFKSEPPMWLIEFEAEGDETARKPIAVPIPHDAVVGTETMTLWMFLKGDRTVIRTMEMGAGDTLHLPKGAELLQGVTSYEITEPPC